MKFPKHPEALILKSGQSRSKVKHDLILQKQHQRAAETKNKQSQQLLLFSP